MWPKYCFRRKLTCFASWAKSHTKSVWYFLRYLHFTTSDARELKTQNCKKVYIYIYIYMIYLRAKRCEFKLRSSSYHSPGQRYSICLFNKFRKIRNKQRILEEYWRKSLIMMGSNHIFVLLKFFRPPILMCNDIC